MPNLTVKVYDSLHDRTLIYKNINVIEIKDDIFKLKEEYSNEQHVYMFSTRYSIIAINVEEN